MSKPFLLSLSQYCHECHFVLLQVPVLHHWFCTLFKISFNVSFNVININILIYRPGFILFDYLFYYLPILACLPVALTTAGARVNQRDGAAAVGRCNPLSGSDLLSSDAAAEVSRCRSR